MKYISPGNLDGREGKTVVNIGHLKLIAKVKYAPIHYPESSYMYLPPRISSLAPPLTLSLSLSLSISLFFFFCNYKIIVLSDIFAGDFKIMF